jgi:hypothetical protein
VREVKGVPVTGEAAEDERRRLLAAAYGRAGAGLEPAEAERLAELMTPLADVPADGGDDARGPGPSPDVSRRGQQADASSTPRRRSRALGAVGALAVLLATFATGWAAGNGVQTREDTVTQIPVDDAIAATLDAARTAAAGEADPDTLTYIGTLFGSAVWEARSADRSDRCFVISAIPDESGPARADLLACAEESAGAAELWTTSTFSESYTARGTIQAEWAGQRPAQLVPAWTDISTTPLEPNAVIERTGKVVLQSAGSGAIPVAVFGLTSLWAVHRQDDLRCVYAVTLVPGSDGSTYRESSACRDDLVYSEQQTWTYPSDDFAPLDTPSGKYIRAVITWLPGEDPVATLRSE